MSLCEQRGWDHIEEYIKGQELVMEIIPLRILKYFIERTTRTPSRHAAPTRIQIMSHSKSKAKEWEMIVNVGFKREIK
ncbi:MAG: hypothetical protein QXU71_02765 [Candidatus Aenigmatarchaeota archaeon]